MVIMERKTKVICGVMLASIIIFTGANSSFSFKKMEISDKMLSCIEALAQDESFTGSAQKNEDTWQDGPFWDSKKKEFYYWVYTDTDCFGRGTIDCSMSRVGKRVPV
jgi:hypothetical protein